MKNAVARVCEPEIYLLVTAQIRLEVHRHLIFAVELLMKTFSRVRCDRNTMGIDKRKRVEKTREQSYV